MGTGCVGCGVIVFISRCSEFGFVACVSRRTVCAVSPASYLTATDRVAEPKYPGKRSFARHVQNPTSVSDGRMTVGVSRT